MPDSTFTAIASRFRLVALVLVSVKALIFRWASITSTLRQARLDFFGCF